MEEGAGPEGRVEEEERGFPEESRCCSSGAGKRCESGMFIPEPNFFPSRIPEPNFPISDPGSAAKNLNIVTEKTVSKLSEI